MKGTTAAGGRRPALLLVDVQGDFLDRPGLEPAREALVAELARVLDAARAHGVPVLHVRTIVDVDGAGRMPHWERDGRLVCLAGTAGAAPPASLAAHDGELELVKRFYSAFDADGLDAELDRRRIDTLIVAGLYLHACVRATVLDAYARGLDVIVAADAVGSTEPAHAELTRAFLAERAARFVPTAALFGGGEEDVPSGAPRADLAGGLGPDATRATVETAVRTARTAQPVWARRRPADRARVLAAWADRLAARESDIVALLAAEIGKPRADARAELERALAHVRTAARLVAATCDERLGAGPSSATLRTRPLGVVGLITPWNNPISIAAGKLAPALGCGNAVVWKPAPEAPRATALLLDAWREVAGEHGGAAVELVSGGGDIGARLAAHPGVDAVSLTGSIGTGRRVAALCARDGRPLQAELGGNNAAIVLADACPERAAPPLARAAFGFAGQRCTATRRLIVERPLAAAFTAAMLAATAALRVGDPADPDTDVGPLVSARHHARVAAAVADARAEGGRVLCGGAAPAGLPGPPFFAPTLVAGLPPTARLVRHETFGPVAVLLVAEDVDHAVRLANDVEHGLVATLVTDDEVARARLLETVEAGMVQLGAAPLGFGADAPFVGWKASAIGPPEHGRADLAFYSRPQVVYEEPPVGRSTRPAARQEESAR